MTSVDMSSENQTSQASRLWRIALQMRAGRNDNFLPPLLFLTDRTRVPDPLTIVKSLPVGSGIVFRDYDLADRAVLAAKLAAAAVEYGLCLLVAGDPGLAHKIGANGVHLPEHQINEARALRQRHPNWIITAAAHSVPALVAARKNGVDAALLSPVFKTASHPDAPALGPTRFATMVRRANMPVYALGGINAGNASRLRQSGAVGFAAIGALAEQAPAPDA